MLKQEALLSCPALYDEKTQLRMQCALVRQVDVSFSSLTLLSTVKEDCVDIGRQAKYGMRIKDNCVLVIAAAFL